MQSYNIASSDIAAEEFDGEYVVLDLKNGMYYSVGPAASVVWRALLAGNSPAALAAALPAGDPRGEQIALTVEAFVGHGLLVPADRQAGEPIGAFADELLARTADFRIEAFGDLADLLIADPIHDVDADMGWPKRPDAADA